MEGTPFGRYRLIQLLGRGGMGEVWRAFDTDTNRVVALKVLPANLANDPQFERRFRREAFAAAGLAEPHVVPIHYFGEIDGRLYVDMRLIEGHDLQAILTHGRLEPVRAIAIIDQIASALEAAHRIGLVHRDVKPSNILVAAKDFAYLIDFGIARAAGETKLTGTGNVIGTWAYLAPERVTSGQTDPRADIYSLACVLHECLTGSQPFPGDSIEQQIGGHLGLPPPRPSQLREELPAELDTVIATGMAKNPDERYSTVTAMADAARAAITAPITRPTAMPPTEPARHNQLPTTRAATPRPPDWTPDGAPPTDPTRSAAAQQGQPFVHTGPTQYRSATDPSPGTPVPDGSTATAQGNFWKRHRVAITGVIAVVAVLAVVGVVVVSNSGDSSPAATSTSQTPAALPNTGPFTGTFTADFGPQLSLSGKPFEDTEPAYHETWRLRSVCTASGCVATANPGGRFPAKELVFDDVGGRWLAVITSQAKCNNIDTERFDVIALQPRPDGTMTGEWTMTTSQGCFIKRTATFTRTGDTDITTLADPASQPRRVVSPAEALHGRYDVAVNFTSGFKQEHDYGVRTDCLRTGERCVSFLVALENSVGTQPLVFGNGKWTRNDEYDSTCSSGGGTIHVKQNAEFALPQPPQDPITMLTGNGHQKETSTACGNGGYDYDEKFVRTGD
jgi:serine/threonine-protein kinase